MGRPLRVNAAGGVYHVTAHGIREWPIYRDRHDYEFFRALFLELAVELEWRCHTYCLMPTHFHLLLEIEHANLSQGMHRLNWRSAMRFNWRYGYKGHLFDRRFYSGVIEAEAHFLETARYIVLNPVRAGICGHPADWEFSSYRGSVGRVKDALLTEDRLLGSFARDVTTARRRFARFVADGVRSSHVRVPGTRTRLDQPKPYVPAKRSANRRTRSAAGSPTTLR
jgi:putative transposase